MLLLMTNRNLHMRFRLAARLMTLDDLELLPWSREDAVPNTQSKIRIFTHANLLGQEPVPPGNQLGTRFRLRSRRVYDSLDL